MARSPNLPPMGVVPPTILVMDKQGRTAQIPATERQRYLFMDQAVERGLGELGCGVIYAFFCINTNKMYIGRTHEAIKKRWQRHCSKARAGSSAAFHSALRENHPDWSTSILAYYKRGDEFNLENYFIKEFKTACPNGYNDKAGTKE